MTALHLLDANVLIRAHADYYPMDRVPQFWDWILKIAQDGHAKMPFQIYTEISIATGPLADWIKDAVVAEALVLDEEPETALIQKVIDEGYAPDLSDDELEKVGRDPFLIGCGLVHPERVVVTKETKAPSRIRANRKIPDVCETMAVSWSTDFAFFYKLGFTTK